ncbi:MAG TPA: Asp-tRNA(Asn)/Glu-tRNA(Gln) amidotransferase subunit GatB [Acidimicrobiales bacterium]|nr:Asp-tRNA(Asn)/Glu-tRNA(Gln) amidotransferase subunit GatB [Acidimicrobiales bacterium]
MTTLVDTEWEVVIGLEVHCELSTATKLFCGCRNAFGDEPNTNICPVCLGLPGSLPVVNRRAVEFAMRIGEALHCTVEPSIFHRKNYFYPDMPKDYQVSQYDMPINVRGWLELPDGSRVGVTRAHMEEDTGKTTHVGGGGRIHEAGYALVDYNRAGVPLVEIVSDPDIRSAEQAKSYVEELRAILAAIDVSDVKMEEGSLRVDSNVSVRRAGSSEFGTRCEIKNLNSLRSLVHAVEYEARRQVDLLEAGERIVQETRHWNEEQGRTHSLRSKEEAFDYRYFPEPDLLPVEPSDDWLARVRSSLPVLPAERRAALAAEAGASSTADVAVVIERGLDALVRAAIAAGADPDRVVTHAVHNLAVEGAANLDPEHLASLVRLETEGKLTATQAKKVLADMLEHGGDPASIAAGLGFEAMDQGAMATVVDQLIADNPTEFDRLKSGDQKVMGFFVGRAMKATQGKADGKVVTALLRERASG